MLGNLELNITCLVEKAVNINLEAVSANSGKALCVCKEIEAEKADMFKAVASLREDAAIVRDILDQFLESTPKVESRDTMRLALDSKIFASGKMGVRINRELTEVSEPKAKRVSKLEGSPSIHAFLDKPPSGGWLRIDDREADIVYLGSIGKNILRNPFSVVATEAGELVVTDRPLNTVFKFSRTGDLIARNDSFQEPMGLFRQGKNIWVCDKVNRRLTMLDRDLRIVEEISLKTILGDNHPTNLPAYGCYEAGRIYLVVTDADAVERAVVIIDPETPESSWSLLETNGFPPYRVRFIDGRLCLNRMVPPTLFSLDELSGGFQPWSGFDQLGYMYDFKVIDKDLVVTMDRYLQVVFGDGSIITADMVELTDEMASRIVGIETVSREDSRLLYLTDLYQGCVHVFSM